MKKGWWWGVVCLSLLALPAAAQGPAVLARVDGAAITDAMVKDVVKALIAQEESAPSSDEIARLTDVALASLIDFELLYAAAQRERIQVSDEEVAAEIARSKARVGGDQAFAAALRASGLSESALAAETHKTLMVDRFVEQRLMQDVRLDPAAARRFYDENQKEFQHGGQARVRELLVRAAPTAPPAERARARQVADDVRRLLHGGADFGALAKAHPVDPATAARGGDRGFIGRGILPPALDEAAFSLPIGQVSEVIESPAGYHVIVVTERRPPGVVSFEEARPTVERALRESERRQRQEAYLGELRRTARIERLTPGP